MQRWCLVICLFLRLNTVAMKPCSLVDYIKYGLFSERWKGWEKRHRREESFEQKDTKCKQMFLTNIIIRSFLALFGIGAAQSILILAPHHRENTPTSHMRYRCTLGLTSSPTIPHNHNLWGMRATVDCCAVPIIISARESARLRASLRKTACLKISIKNQNCDNLDALHHKTASSILLFTENKYVTLQ